MSEFKAGDEALLRVKVFNVINGTAYLRHHGTAKVADLLPVPQADEGAIERATRVLVESSGLDWRLVGDEFRESFRRHARALAAAGLLADPDAIRQAKAGSVVHSPASIKSVGEALKYAEAALLNFYHDNGQRSMYAEILRELLADIERQRPTGPDGKHGDRHTPTCGCADRIGGE